MTQQVEEFARGQRRIASQGTLAAGPCIAVLIVAVLLLPEALALPTDFASQLKIALTAELFVAAWVVFGVLRVSTVRYHSPEDHAGSAYGRPSARLAVPAAFLQNTLEQAFIAFIAHLALVATTGQAGLAYVLAATALFAVGRVTFLTGYSRGAGGRAFGMITTLLPTLIAFGWAAVAAVANVAAP